MPLETLAGPEISALMAQAQQRLGPDAVILSVCRAGRLFELVAADPETAAQHERGPAAAPAREGGSRIIALVGPTGAGKTTTIAKLANHPRVFGKQSVGLLCLDTYRIGGAEQLRIYAELSHLPIEVCYDEEDLAGALRRLEDCELILVDTAGRGPRGAADQAATRAQLARLRPDEVHLTLPAGLQPPLVEQLVREYQSRGVTHLLATKLDEYPEEQTTFQLAHAIGLPMRWVTNGQTVPDDIGPAPAPLAQVARVRRVKAGAA
jgi:flagellar biosynthesis protein FlhF